MYPAQSSQFPYVPAIAAVSTFCCHQSRATKMRNAKLFERCYFAKTYAVVVVKHGVPRRAVRDIIATVITSGGSFIILVMKNGAVPAGTANV